MQDPSGSYGSETYRDSTLMNFMKL
eukprot:SAG11_NODE_8550_length_1002_cov_0.841639_3_plen_24_part_01